MIFCRSSSVVARPSSDLNNRVTLVRILSPALCANSSIGRAQCLPFWVRSPASVLRVRSWGCRFKSCFALFRQVAQVCLKLVERYIFNVEDGGSNPSLLIWFGILRADSSVGRTAPLNVGYVVGSSPAPPFSMGL